MFAKTFKTIFSDNQDRNGQTFEVIGDNKEHPDFDFHETGVMWRIRFTDGAEIWAHPEEVETEWQFQ